MSIGSNLKALRQQRKMTQAELAHRAEITQGQLSAYENDKIDNIPIEKLSRIADALRVSAAEIEERLFRVPGITVSGGQNIFANTGTFNGNVKSTVNTVNGTVGTYNAGNGNPIGNNNMVSQSKNAVENFRHTVIDVIMGMEEIDPETKIMLYQKIKSL